MYTAKIAVQKFRANFYNFQKTTQCKQSANGRKFAQSGHPEEGERKENPVARQGDQMSL
jgi:hypothetical protein